MSDIDFEKITKDSSTLIGRPKGVALRVHFNLDELDKLDEVVHIRAPETLKLMSTSFVQGMFSKSVQDLGGEDAFFQKYEFDALPSFLSSLRSGMKRIVMDRSQLP